MEIKIECKLRQRRAVGVAMLSNATLGTALSTSASSVAKSHAPVAVMPCCDSWAARHSRLSVPSTIKRAVDDDGDDPDARGRR